VSTQTRRRAMSLPLLLAVLLVVAAALFGVGVAVEHSGARVAVGLRAGATLTGGFVAVLAAAGLAVPAGLRSVTAVAPWLAVAVCAILLLAGLVLFVRAALPVHLPALAAGRRGGLLAYGAGYVLSSLACTLGVLLAVIAQAPRRPPA
jgi:cytochrome c-type biogenesis protein